MAISITNDTILKLLSRQGTNAERLNVLLNSGEFAFTTDTERLFIGNGADNGGVLTGNVFKGSNSDITTFSPAEIGDLAYNSDTNVLYRLSTSEGSLLSDWEKIGGAGVTSDTTQALGGVQIDNLVRVTSVQWSTLSASNDSNTFYIVSNVNYIIK